MHVNWHTSRISNVVSESPCPTRVSGQQAEEASGGKPPAVVS